MQPMNLEQLVGQKVEVYQKSALSGSVYGRSEASVRAWFESEWEHPARERGEQGLDPIEVKDAQVGRIA